MAGTLQLRKDSSQVITRSGLVLLFKQAGNQLTMHALKPLQKRLGTGGIAMARRFNSLENQIGHAGHRGNHHNDPVMPGRFAHDGSTLAETLRISNRGAAKLHHDQTLPVHYAFSSFCNTAPILSIRGTRSRVTPAPLLSAEVNIASVCTPSLAKILCNSSATRISSPVANAITDEPDPLIATPSKPGSRKPRQRSIPGTNCWRYG